jgi:hypothetical protein
MSNRKTHNLFQSPGSQNGIGIVRLDNNRSIAGYAGNINPAFLSKSAATTFCIALKHQSSMESPFKAHGCFYEDDKGTVFSRQCGGLERGNPTPIGLPPERWDQNLDHHGMGQEREHSHAFLHDGHDLGIFRLSVELNAEL